MAQSLNRLGNWHVNIGETEEGLRLHAEALALFEACDDTQGRADTLDLISMANGLHGNMTECLLRADAAIELYRRARRPARAGVGAGVARHVVGTEHAGRDGVGLPFVRGGAPRHERRAARWRARSAGSPGRRTPNSRCTSVLCGFGRFREAFEHGHEGLRIATEMQHEQWTIGAHFTLGQAYMLLEAPEPALRHLEEALPIARRVGSSWWTGQRRLAPGARRTC